MDQDLALIIANSSIRSAREMGELMRIIPDDCKDIKLKIAEIVDEIYRGIVSEIYREHPEIKNNMERRLARYDRFI